MMIELYDKFLQRHGMLEKVKVRNVSPDQKGDFIAKLITLYKFHNILEIGRCNGYSFGLFGFFSPLSHILSLDIKPTDEALGVAQLLGGDWKFIDDDSSVLQYMDTKFDLVLVDGDHSFDGVQFDWNNIQTCINNNTVIMIDDLSSSGGKIFRQISEDQYDKLVVYDMGVLYHKDTFNLDFATY